MPKNLAQTHKLTSIAEHLCKSTHFTTEECLGLISIFQKMQAFGQMDRMRMREILHVVFHITDDVMLDLVFHAFDQDSNGFIDDSEWVKGISVMLRGTTDELIEWCYFVYDLNGDGGLAREELFHCLKGCIYSGYGIDADEIDEAERDIVEIAMRVLDVDKDGQITVEDFQKCCTKNPLMLVSIGPCLPPHKCIASFLALITEKYRNYTGAMGRNLGNKKKPKVKEAVPFSQMTFDSMLGSEAYKNI